MKMFESGTTTLIISNEEVNDINKSLEESVLLIKGVNETIKNEVKERKASFWNLWASKGTIREGTGAIATSRWQGTIRASQDF